MKKISVLLAFVALLFANLALAQGSGVVKALTGTASVQTGQGTPRVLRLGDQVQQGDTISTGADSAVALRFDDGQVTALSQNSRMTITAYQFEPASGKGNMLLSLVTGGMRAITGLLGRNNPDRVAYRAGVTTIGIRGTDVAIGYDPSNGDVEVKVNEGAVTITVGGKMQVVNAGETYFVHNGVITPGPAAPAGFSPIAVAWVNLITQLNLGQFVGGLVDNGPATFGTGVEQTTISNGSGGGSVSSH